MDDVQLPLGLAVASCSQTVTCIPSCTGATTARRCARAPPQTQPLLSTTIIYPKYPKTIYTTTLDYNCRKTLRRFLSSVELEATEFKGSDYLLEENWTEQAPGGRPLPGSVWLGQAALVCPSSPRTV